MVKLAGRARCHACGLIAEGDPARVDRAAQKHVAAGHPVATETRPVP